VNVTIRRTTRRQSLRRRLEGILVAFFTIRWLMRVLWRGARASVA